MQQQLQISGRNLGQSVTTMGEEETWVGFHWHLMHQEQPQLWLRMASRIPRFPLVNNHSVLIEESPLMKLFRPCRDLKDWVPFRTNLLHLHLGHLHCFPWQPQLDHLNLVDIDWFNIYVCWLIIQQLPVGLSSSIKSKSTSLLSASSVWPRVIWR